MLSQLSNQNINIYDMNKPNGHMNNNNDMLTLIKTVSTPNIQTTPNNIQNNQNNNPISIKMSKLYK